MTHADPVSPAQLEAYLTRIGVPQPAAADAVALRRLHRAHLLAVPFENLSIHLGEPISLAPGDLLAKVVSRHRGGFCYELNGAFALLLEGLGFGVRRVAARVDGAGGKLGPPFDHLALLADVPGGGDLDVLRDGTPQYRVEPRARRLSDYAPTCWWQQTWPSSHFRSGPVASVQTADGQVTVAGRTLIRTAGTERTETPLGSDAEVLAAYREHLGIELDRAP